MRWCGGEATCSIVEPSNLLRNGMHKPIAASNLLLSDNTNSKDGRKKSARECDFHKMPLSEVLGESEGNKLIRGIIKNVYNLAWKIDVPIPRSLIPAIM